MSFSFVPITASRLRRRSVESRGKRVKDVSIFPFFEQSGRVRRVVLVAPESSEFFVLPLAAKLEAPLFGRVRATGGAPPFEPLRKAQLSELAALWHYDPVWVLDDERFAGHWAKEPLENTNCVARLPPKSILSYSGDLSRVQWIAYHDAEGGVSVSRWDDSRLPYRPPRLKSIDWRRPSPTWILDPIWSAHRRVPSR